MTRDSTHSGGGGMIEGSWPKNWQGGGQGSLSTTVGYRVPTIVTNLFIRCIPSTNPIWKRFTTLSNTEFQLELRAFVSPWNLKLWFQPETKNKWSPLYIDNMYSSFLPFRRHLISSHLTRHACDKFHAWMVSKYLSLLFVVWLVGIENEVIVELLLNMTILRMRSF